MKQPKIHRRKKSPAKFTDKIDPWVRLLRDIKKMSQIKVSDWIIIDGYCATRIIDGGDVKNVADRVAFIEKTPRVRIQSTTIGAEEPREFNNWEYGPKGSGGCGNPKVNNLYGFYQPSRDWCDKRLKELGYEILPKYLIGFYHGFNKNLEHKCIEHCSEEDGSFYWGNSLDDFAKIFPMFMLRKNMLWITQYNNFGQR
jgi:hypothetical protein